MKFFWIIFIYLISFNLWSQDVILKVVRSAALIKFEKSLPKIGDFYHVIDSSTGETIGEVEIRELYKNRALATIRSGKGRIKIGDAAVSVVTFSEFEDSGQAEPRAIPFDDIDVQVKGGAEEDTGGMSLSSSSNRRFFFVTPQLGYVKSMTSAQDYSSGGDETENVASYGLLSYGSQAGFCFSGLLFGAHLMFSQGDVEYTPSNSAVYESSIDEEKRMIWGPFMGYRFKNGIQFYATYYLKASIEDVASGQILNGKGYGVALGYGRKFFSINLEYRSLLYDSLIDGNSEIALPAGDKSTLYLGDMSSSEISLNIGIPLEFSF